MADEALVELVDWLRSHATDTRAWMATPMTPFHEDVYAATMARADALESALSELARLRAEREVDTPVIYAARLLVAADTYKHPMLSRADAVKAGVAELHDAVQRWQSAQPAQRQIQSHEEKRG